MVDDLAVRFAAEVAKLKQRIDDLEKGTRSPQLNNASLDLGSGRGYIPIKDGGKEMGRLGRQPDGTINFTSMGNETPPSIPIPIQCAPGLGVVEVTCYGLPGLQPFDFSHVKIYVDGIAYGNLSQLPGTLIVGPLSYENHAFYATSVNLSGTESDPTDLVFAAPNKAVGDDITNGIIDALKIADDAITRAKVAVGAIGPVELGDLAVAQQHIQDGSVTPAKLSFTIGDLASIATYFQDAEPTGVIPTGSLWYDSNDTNKVYRYSGSAWVLATDTQIQAALLAAQTAQTDAAAALSTATTAQATADGKVDVFYTGTTPTGASLGDLWINTADSKRLYRYDGTTWQLSADQTAAAALAAASTAQSTADGKIRAFYQDTAPSSGQSVGDLWYETDNGNAASRWNGSSWTPLPVGTGAIGNNAITASKILAAQVLAEAIATNAIIAGKIAANTITTTEIAALTILAGDIAADAIAAGKIAANAITAREIQALAITVDKMAANSVTAAQIQAGSIDADKLAAQILMASQIIIGDPNDWHLELNGINPTTPILWWNNIDTGFALSRDPETGLSNCYLSGRMQFGQGSQLDSDVIDLMQLPSTGYQQPKARQQRAWIQSAFSGSITPQYLSPTMRGNTVVMTVFQIGNGATPNCGTPAGSTLVYSLINGLTRLSVFIVQNTPASRSFETFGSTAATCRWAITLSEYTGLQAAAFDVYAFNSGTGTAVTTGTTSTSTFTNEMQLAVVGAATGQGANGVFNSPTNSFTKALMSGSDNGFGTGLFTKKVTATGAATMGVTIPSAAWTAIILTFKIAPAAATPPPPPDNTVRFYTQQRSGKATPHVMDANGYSYPFGRLPYCTVRSTANFAVAANTYIWAQANWTAAEDPDNMVAAGATGVYSTITIPITGRYLVNYRTIYEADTSIGDNGACMIGRNGRDVNFFLASDSRRFVRYGSDFHSPVQAIRLCSLLAGDILYWGNWTDITKNVFAALGPMSTEITVSMINAY